MAQNTEKIIRGNQIMAIDIERIAKLEAQVEGIKEDVAAVKQDIKELHSRITTGNREITDHIDKKIDDLAKSDEEQHDAMGVKIDALAGRIDLLERWKWMIVGGAIVVGYLVGHLDFFAKFLK
jgi:predicted  nucleic acid-binding Zn-ribbon protein